jgi:thiamine pyrophosphate-dependent acetolactate synthase large subunit-like protein
LGAFSTIAQHRPANLSIVVLDNEQYAETGMQKTATGFGTDLAAVARACGLQDATVLTEKKEVAALRTRIHAKSGTLVAVLKIKPGDQPRTVPEREGTLIASRFMRSLAADQARA